MAALRSIAGERSGSPVVCSVPARSGNNSYITKINDALEGRGIQVMRPPRDLHALREVLQPNLILHFHWPSRLYTKAGTQGRAAALRDWEEFLALARKVGCPIIWTAHNVYPHESPSTEVDVAGRRMLVAAADHVIVHCECAIHAIEAEFGRVSRYSVVRHPCYEFATVTRSQRPATGTTTFLIFGLLRAYKNLEFVAQTFSGLERADFRLVIAGQPHHSYSPDRLRAICEADPRISLLEGEVAEEDIPALFAATDVALFGYSQVLSSGTIALAQSLSKPVLAPRLGCIPDAVPDSTGELYEANSRESLGAAMCRIATRDLAAMGARARTEAHRETPASFAAKLEAIYRSL